MLETDEQTLDEQIQRVKAIISVKRMFTYQGFEEVFGGDIQIPEQEGSILSRLVFLKGLRDLIIPQLEQYTIGNGSVLEVGTGTGFFARHIAPSWLLQKLISYDVIFDCLAKKREEQPESVNVQASTYKLPFKSESVSAAIAYSSLDSNLLLYEALKELYRVLLPGGFLLTYQDLTTDLYNPNPREGLPGVDSVEVYHRILIEQVIETGFTPIGGQEDWLAISYTEDAVEIMQRVDDFDLVGLKFPVNLFLDRGGYRPPRTRALRQQVGCTKDELIRDLRRFYNLTKPIWRHITDKIWGIPDAGKVNAHIRIRFLVAQKNTT